MRLVVEFDGIPGLSSSLSMVKMKSVILIDQGRIGIGKLFGQAQFGLEKFLFQCFRPVNQKKKKQVVTVF